MTYTYDGETTTTPFIYADGVVLENMPTSLRKYMQQRKELLAQINVLLPQIEGLKKLQIELTASLTKKEAAVDVINTKIDVLPKSIGISDVKINSSATSATLTVEQ